MPDYKTEQDWLMSQIEVQQKQFERQELIEVVEGIDRKLRSKIVRLIRLHKGLAKVSAKVCFDRWKAGYMTQKPGAVAVLEQAKLLDDDSSSGLKF
jgi:hypothetical protein